MELIVIIVSVVLGILITRVCLAIFGPLVTFVVVAVLLYVALGGDAQAATDAANTVTPPPVTLQDSLVSIISSVQSGVQAGVNFLSAEIPDVIRQLLIWKAVESGIWVCVHGLLIITGAMAFIKGYKAINEQNRLEAEGEALGKAIEARGRSDTTGLTELMERYTAAMAAAHAQISKTLICCIVGAIWTTVGLISLCNIFPRIFTVTQIWIAPKVWLIEYAASLVK